MEGGGEVRLSSVPTQSWYCVEKWEIETDSARRWTLMLGFTDVPR